MGPANFDGGSEVRARYATDHVVPGAPEEAQMTHAQMARSHEKWRQSIGGNQTRRRTWFSFLGKRG